jgi:2-polyprenyl-6-methoxyphenol hydroxylase-like FAD-dependent oxidoreductase
MAQANVDPNAFSDFLNQFIPQFSSLLDDETIANVAKSAPSFLPAFRYVKPRLHQGKRTVLLGDCAHTVKPYFGMGANSALEDVKVRYFYRKKV